MPMNTPLEITLTANDGSNQIYISTNTSLNGMQLMLTNTTTANVVFQQYTNGSSAINQLPATNSGIYLLFNGLLTDAVIAGMTITASGWTPQAQRDNQNGQYWVLLPSSNVTLAPGASLNFTLSFPAITGSANSGYFSCQYVNVQAESLTSDGEQLYVQLVYPPRTDESSPALLPIQFEFINGDVVYTGGLTNRLTMRITNTSDAPLIPLGTQSWGSPDPQFTLTFVQDENVSIGSLMTAIQAGATNYDDLQLYGNKLRIDKPSSTSPQVYTITQDDRMQGTTGTILGTGTSASISFSINNISTSVAAETITMAILEYKGFPGYEDGQVTAEIKIKSYVGDPSITSYYTSASKINIKNISNSVSVYFQTYNASNVKLYQEYNCLKDFDNPGSTEFQATTVIDHTTSFLLVASNSLGKSVSRVITIQVDTVPIGTIAMWNGEQATIPDGWKICDGHNNTPNLTERFIFGASVDAPPVTTLHYLHQMAGGEPHNHSINIPGQSISIASSGHHSHTTKYNIKNTLDDNSNSHDRYYYYGADDTVTTDGGSNDGLHTHSATSPAINTYSGATAANFPPYYALYYIMKCS